MINLFNLSCRIRFDERCAIVDLKLSSLSTILSDRSHKQYYNNLRRDIHFWSIEIDCHTSLI